MGNVPSGRDGPHAFVHDLESPEVDDGDRHHLSKVLRLRSGDPLTVCDGAGRWRRCRFDDAIEPDGPVIAVDRPRPSITVAFAVVKGERPDWTVQKLTELGVDHIRPFVAARSVVRWDERRAATNLERFRRVAREASMQSRQVWLPAVAPLSTFAEVAALPGAARCDRDGEALTLSRPCVLVGPEGGWAPQERAADLPVATLGPHVLRTETAAITAAALLTAYRYREP